MAKSPYKNLKQLGHVARIASAPDQALIEKVPNPFPEHDYLVRFTCPEMTCLCPVTAQPDFAHFVIDYAPGKWLVESKSLKLYFESFRNFGVFHETATVGIADRLIKEIKPKWLRVSGYWYPRGGMPIDVFFEKGKRPSGVVVPDTGVASYRGRG
jgi:7-cyano-7-deazaguanine reductase